MCTCVCSWGLGWKLLSPEMNFVYFCQVPWSIANKELYKTRLMWSIQAWAPRPCEALSVTSFFSILFLFSFLSLPFKNKYCVLLFTVATFLGLRSGWSQEGFSYDVSLPLRYSPLKLYMGENLYNITHLGWTWALTSALFTLSGFQNELKFEVSGIVTGKCPQFTISFGVVAFLLLWVWVFSWNLLRWFHK